MVIMVWNRLVFIAKNLLLRHPHGFDKISKTWVTRTQLNWKYSKEIIVSDYIHIRYCMSFFNLCAFFRCRLFSFLAFVFSSFLIIFFHVSIPTIPTTAAAAARQKVENSKCVLASIRKWNRLKSQFVIIVNMLSKSLYRYQQDRRMPSYQMKTQKQLTFLVIVLN